ncbi:hypothetical protein HGRIS_003116 [Hohenbuehelia grisea]|uniref:Uncharacterized protein n=1 Tax=Hohenbuehelia grisea TaxID=104357 RepID=A0ABR3JNH4_9AGAR
MGVRDLWKITKAATEHETFATLARTVGSQKAPVGARVLVLGVDASIWFYQCQSMFVANRARAGENPALRTMFYRLCRLLKAPVLPVFVFDGTGPAEVKRNRKVGKAEHWLLHKLKKLLRSFAFAYYTAPGEAEAELSKGCELGVFDAVLTDDSDALVFGAPRVIRNPNVEKDGDTLRVTSFSSVEAICGLNRSGLVLVSLLVGNDYAPAGLPGCGAKIAAGLARTPLADGLYNTVTSLSAVMLTEYLLTRRNDLRHELSTNSTGLLPHKCKELASHVSSSFPNVAVVHTLVFPTTSWSNGANGRGQRPWELGRPDLAELASHCSDWFSWPKRIVLLKFCGQVWDGALFRSLLLSQNASSHPDIVRILPGVRQGDFRRVRYSVGAVRLLTLAGVQDDHNSEDEESAGEGADMADPSLPTRLVMLPRDIFEPQVGNGLGDAPEVLTDTTAANEAASSAALPTGSSDDYIDLTQDIVDAIEDSDVIDLTHDTDSDVEVLN